MGYAQGDQKEGEKQVAPLVEERKGSLCIDVADEGPNGKRSKDLTPKSKPILLVGKRGAKEEIGKLGKPSRGKI
jgi:hypothetical protein